MAIRYPGGYPFEQRGTPQYFFGGWDLDRLVIPYRGKRPDLDAFLAGVVAAEWAPSQLNPNMFLSGYSVGTDKVAPEVQLVYSGKKSGQRTLDKHTNAQELSNGQATVPFTGESFSISYLAPVKIRSWISRVDESGSQPIDLFGVPLPSNTYQITGIVSFVNGSDILGGIGTSYLSQVNVGDQLHVITNTVAPASDLDLVGFIATVVKVTDNTHMQISTPFSGTSGHTWAPDKSFGIHLGNIQVSVLDIRVTLGGFGTLLTGATAAELWGPIIVSSFFRTLIVPTIESEELIPGQYWRNTQRSVVTLLPAYI
jgi:hypothetical protein